MENKEIQVILHNGDEIIPFRVRILDTIRTILCELKSNASTYFVYKNNVLLSAFTFAFYGITEGSHIYSVTVPPKENADSPIKTETNSLCTNLCSNLCTNPSATCKNLLDKEKFKTIFQKLHQKKGCSKFCNLFCDDDENDSFETSYKTYSDPLFAREAAKIKDRFFQRVEGTIKCHRKLLKHFIQSSCCSSRPPAVANPPQQQMQKQQLSDVHQHIRPQKKDVLQEQQSNDLQQIQHEEKSIEKNKY